MLNDGKPRGNSKLLKLFLGFQMSFLDKLVGKKESESVKSNESDLDSLGDDSSTQKFDMPCALCGQSATEVKWAGQYWHKKCKRKSKKMVKGMV